MTKGDDLRSFYPFYKNICEISDEKTPKKKKPSGLSNIKTEKKSLLPKQDYDYLSKYINPIYLKNDAIKSINDQFCNESSIQVNYC